MNNEDLKEYTVLVGVGSGCLFQPMTEEYTYILTAKHLFFRKETDDRGENKYIQFPDNTKIDIRQGIRENSIDFTLREGITYFPHKEADAAILKIKKIDGYDKICFTEPENQQKEFLLCGYPNNFREERTGNKYTHYKISEFIVSGDYIYSAQLKNTLSQAYIEGMSGGGILRVEDEHLVLAGIQSKMANKKNYQPGQIAFSPIKYFKEICNYPEYESTLEKLYPLYMKKFKFLLNDCFTLNVDALDEPITKNISTYLRNKAFEITNSDVTPIGIKALFGQRLLISENEKYCLYHKKVWIAWLEFLTIINIVKDTVVDSTMLSEIFDTYRLKYANIDDWTKIIRSDLLNSDYYGLKKNGTVVVSTRNIPKDGRNFYIPKERMIRIAEVPDVTKFRADRGLAPHSSFNYLHMEYFKTECIINKLDDYYKLNEVELHTKLKTEYYELFN